MMSVIGIVAQLVQLGIPLAKEIIDAVNAEMVLSGAGRPPTPDEQAAIDAGLKAAHEALQNAQQEPTADTAAGA